MDHSKTSPIKTLLVILLLILFSPLGVILMWFLTKWPLWIKITLTILFGLFLLPAFFILLYLFIAQPVKMSGQSMSPTFNRGDYLMIEKITYFTAKPSRFDIVVFQKPTDHSYNFIGRIIGLPGDKVEIKNYQIFINGQQLAEPYLKIGTQTRGSAFIGTDPITVPGSSYFEMGDNRNQSSDSREWGFVKREEIVGKYYFTYYKAPK